MMRDEAALVEVGGYSLVRRFLFQRWQLMISVLGLSACVGASGSDAESVGTSRQAASSLETKLAFASSRDNPAAPNPLLAAEIYVMNPDTTEPVRLTNNGVMDLFPVVSPAGTQIVFESSRISGQTNVSDLFVMERNGSDQRFLVRGSSASWSTKSGAFAYHASASGSGTPIKLDPGAPASDSDIFIANVDDLLEGTGAPVNLTHNPAAIDDDPSWSPDGTKIAFTSHLVSDNPNNSVTAEIYVISADGSAPPVRLTFNAYEERAPTWSPDGTTILHMCRIGPPLPGMTVPTFELCIVSPDGSGLVSRLTNNAVQELTANFSLDGAAITFQRGLGPGVGLQLFRIDSDGGNEQQLTFPPGQNAFASWGGFKVNLPSTQSQH